MNSIAVQQTSTTPILARLSSLLVLTVFLSFGMLGNSNANADKTGNWIKKSHKIKGGWSIVKEGDQTVIRFDKKFKTKKAPDLKLFLSKKNLQDRNGKNATEDAVLISPLSSHSGTQEYIIPANINLDDYTSLLIHCEQYAILWGGATL